MINDGKIGGLRRGRWVRKEDEKKSSKRQE